MVALHVVIDLKTEEMQTRHETRDREPAIALIELPLAQVQYIFDKRIISRIL